MCSEYLESGTHCVLCVPNTRTQNTNVFRTHGTQNTMCSKHIEHRTTMCSMCSEHLEPGTYCVLCSEHRTQMCSKHMEHRTQSVPNTWNPEHKMCSSVPNPEHKCVLGSGTQNTSVLCSCVLEHIVFCVPSVLCSTEAVFFGPQGSASAKFTPFKEDSF